MTPIFYLKVAACYVTAADSQLWNKQTIIIFIPQVVKKPRVKNYYYYYHHHHYYYWRFQVQIQITSPKKEHRDIKPLLTVRILYISLCVSCLWCWYCFRILYIFLCKFHFHALFCAIWITWCRNVVGYNVNHFFSAHAHSRLWEWTISGLDPSSSGGIIVKLRTSERRPQKRPRWRAGHS